MDIKLINQPKFTLYLAVYPVDDIKKDVHERDVLFVYPFKPTIMSNDVLMEIIEHLLVITNKSNISLYGERCYVEMIVYRDGVYYDHDNKVVFVDPHDHIIRYNADNSDISLPECDFTHFKCIDIVDRLINGQDTSIHNFGFGELYDEL